MKLIPNWEQWKKWSLPNKYTSGAFILALIALTLNLVVPHCGPSKKVQKDIKASLQKLMDYYEIEYRDALRSKYTEGYCLFAIDQKEIVIPNASIINNRFEIDWNGVTVIRRTPHQIVMKIATIIDLANQNYVYDTVIVFSREEGMSGPFLSIGGMLVYTEVIDNKSESTVVVLGFQKQNQNK